MSGHNKWSKIKHKKAAGDAAKSKVFGKYARLITVEAKKVGGNLESPRLKAVIEKAKKDNMPNDNIERAVKKATEAGGGSMEEVIYEAYGPGGVAIVISGLTDNRNKAAAEIKHILSKNDCELAAPGSALWAFSKNENDWTPNTTIPINDTDGDKLQKIIEELEDNDEVQEVFTNAE
ncbi:MAG: YebC/PmpR family DNA-binding transcriptional regulator [Parcubacteria group bacterium CG11_big_fil_rev_8_21_14_0_20_39_22]|nr:MAG: YebC/PmpR family DNA-binding transcriptional regulator [Parcubacteria group bacterium CG11_big_fil_rev_8_21_14_0_20_39_22]